MVTGRSRPDGACGAPSRLPWRFELSAEARAAGNARSALAWRALRQALPPRSDPWSGTMQDDLRCRAVDPVSLPARSGSGYPGPSARRLQGASSARSATLRPDPVRRHLVELPPGCWSSQRHWHSHEDELVYIVSGEVVLVTDAGEQTMRAGMIAGFPAGTRDGHHLINRSGAARELPRDRHPHRRGRGGLFRHRHGASPAARGRPRLRAQERRALLSGIRKEDKRRGAPK